MSRQVAGCVALLAVLVGGCGVDVEDRPAAVPAAQLPAGLQPGASVAPASPLTAMATVYLVGSGGVLVPRAVEAAQDSPRAAVDALLAVDAPQGGSRSAIPPGTRLTSASVDDSTITLDLTSPFGEVRGSDQVLAVGQLVWTVTEDPTVRSVRLRVAGRDAPVPSGTGGTTAEPVGRDEYRALAPRG